MIKEMRLFIENYKNPWLHMINYVLARDFGIYLSRKARLKSGLVMNLVDYTRYMTINEALNAHNYYHIDEFPAIKPEIVLDIGANMGDFSIFASRFARKIFAFEPVPCIFDAFGKNIDDNRISNILAYELALSDKTGTAKIHFDKSMSGMSRTTGQAGKDTVTISTMSWSDMHKMIGSPEIDIMKLDCEGGEYSLLNDPDILSHIKDIRCEIHVFSDEDISRACRLVDLLYKYGFECTCHEKEDLKSCFSSPERMEIFYFKKRKGGKTK